MLRRNWLVAAALTAAVGMGSLCAQETPPETTAKKLTPEELKALVGGSTKYFFLDVREPKELEELGTIRGYVNIPLGELEKRLPEIPRDVLVVVACNRAVRAAKGAAILEKAGYKQLQLCAMNEYKEKGYEVIYPKPPAPVKPKAK
jgi:rhodanese-related sulfurtransferase